MSKKQHNIKKNRLAIVPYVANVLLFIIMGIVTYGFVSQLLISEINANGRSVAKTLADEIDGDAFSRIWSRSDPEYDQIYSQLTDFYAYGNIQYIYTMRLQENGVLSFVVDADPNETTEVGEVYDWVEDMAPAFYDGVPCSDSKMITDSWGTFYSSYAPIFRSDGSIAGIVGVDIKTDHVSGCLRQLRFIIILVVSVFAIAAMAMYLFFGRRLSGQDRLTGLPNYEEFVRMCAKIEKSGKLSDYTAFHINVKGFKYINRKYGYITGNEVLVGVAEFIKEKLKKNEIVGRTGNDNFVALVFNENAGRFQVRLKSAVPKTDNPEEVGPNKLPSAIRCSIYKIKPGDTMDVVLNSCTMALSKLRYEKAVDDFIEYEDEMFDNILKDGDILTSYRKAINNGEFVVYYQPKVDIRNNALCGAEALVRWKKDGQLIYPGTFVPILETEGLITALDMYVYERVCKDIREWEDMGITPVPISSNFSKLHLDNPDFPFRVVGMADMQKVDHKYLCVELTESSGYANQEALDYFVEKMKEAGISVAMDDFGTGYSSLSLLGEVQMDEVKIDKSFVDRISDTSLQGATMVRNVIRMILDLDRKVICEGVETKEQVEFLREAGCNIIQGFYFDAPLDKDEFTDRLKMRIYKAR